MKSIILIVLLTVSTFSFSQSLSSLIGRTYTEKTELKELESFIQFDARVDLDRYICRYFWNPTNYQRVFVIEKEIRKDTINTFKIIDLVVAPKTEENEFVIIGSYNGNKEKGNYRFIIAIECCYDNKVAMPEESDRIKRIWTFSNKNSKFIELKGRKYTRIGEGYIFVLLVR